MRAIVSEKDFYDELVRESKDGQPPLPYCNPSPPDMAQIADTVGGFRSHHAHFEAQCRRMAPVREQPDKGVHCAVSDGSSKGS